MLSPTLLAVRRAKASHLVARRSRRGVWRLQCAGVSVTTNPLGVLAATTVTLAGGFSPRAERSRNKASTTYVRACACSGAISTSSIVPRTSMLRPTHALPTRSIRLHQVRSDPVRIVESVSVPREPCSCRACLPSARTSAAKACNATTPAPLAAEPSWSAHRESALEIPPRSCANALSTSPSSSASIGEFRGTFGALCGIMRSGCGSEAVVATCG